ncbi:MAG: hypothetical protein AAFY02_02595 [Pseudomonadota bacterium]
MTALSVSSLQAAPDRDLQAREAALLQQMDALRPEIQALTKTPARPIRLAQWYNWNNWNNWPNWFNNWNNNWSNY